MNERDLDLALHELGAEHVRRTAPPALRDRALAVPLATTRPQPPLAMFLAGNLQPVFGAAKYIVAGIVVALFGGFLVAGILMTQTSDDHSPVGASPSASPQTTDDPLTRLETEAVVPGVLKVVGDAAGRNPSVVRRSIVKDDGTVWGATSGGISDLGQAARYSAAGGYAGWLLDEGADGTLWAANAEGDCDIGLPDIRFFDGQAWTRFDVDQAVTPSASHPGWPPAYLVDFATHPDGSLWAIGGKCGDDAHMSLLWLGADGWTVRGIDGLLEMDCGGPCGEQSSVEITPDGAVWVGIEQGGLLRFDGTRWDVVQPPGTDETYGVTSLATNREGTLWAEIQAGTDEEWQWSRLGEGRYLARYDGQGWEAFYTPLDDSFLSAEDDEYEGPGSILAVGPDGEVWLTDTQPGDGREAAPFPVSFDGERWRRYPEILAHWMTDPRHDPSMRLKELGAWHIAIAPDGTAWVNVDATVGRKSHGGLYVIRPEGSTPMD